MARPRYPRLAGRSVAPDRLDLVLSALSFGLLFGTAVAVTAVADGRLGIRRLLAGVLRWRATVYRGDSVQQGADVGADCTDRVLENVYAQGPLDTTNGSDIVLWVAIRHHHEPRFDGEEAEYLPYHYEEFHLVPRGFEVLRVRDQGLDHG